MIGKLQTGKTFKGCIEYCLSDKKINGRKINTAHRVSVLYYNLCFGDKKNLIRDFNEVAALNPKQSRPVFHLTLSLAKDEKQETNNWLTIAEEAAKTFGFENNQYIMVGHNDTEKHEHVHIVANRISFEGRTTVTDSNSYKKIAGFCRQMEQRFNLTQVLSPKKFLPKEKRLLPRSDERKIRLTKMIKEAVEKATTLNDFIATMQRQGVLVKTGRGIYFIDDKKMRAKGSELGYPFAKITTIISKNLEAQQEQKKQQELTEWQQLKQKQTEYINISRPRSRGI